MPSSPPSVRPRVSLNGTWSFWPDILGKLPGDPGDVTFVPADERTATVGPPRPIAVPGAWQDQFEELHLWAGTAWYCREVEVPASWSGRRMRLRFGAVDYHATVWVNGVFVGAHEGGYLPFDLDIAHAVRPGPNDVTVRVIDVGRPIPGEPPPPFPFDEIPHGKQRWYGPMGGIWQPVVLEASATNPIVHLSGHGDVERAEGVFGFELAEPATGGERITIALEGPGGLDVWTACSDPLDSGVREGVVRVAVRLPERWEVSAPRLYTATAGLETGGDEVDRTRTTIGFRTIETRDGTIVLNGRAVYLRGALDQDYVHVAATPQPTDDVFRQQITVAKELGLNLLRCHIKAPDPRYLAWADRLGMLIWEEIPSWHRFTQDAGRRARETFAQMVRRDGHHPSVVIWTLVNESWGVDLVHDPEHRRWLTETFDWAKQVDPTRLIVDNSPCRPNFHLASDVNDFHWYRAVPEHLEEWQAITARWVAGPGTTYGPPDEVRRTGDEPLVLSEFGTWGLPDVANLLDDRGQEPWWFAKHMRGEDLVDEATGVLERFRASALDEVFGSWDGFVAESQLHQFEALKAEIEDIRRHQEIAGYVVTQLTDVHWESNGLLDMARNPKVYHHRFRQVNAADAVVPMPTRWRAAAGDEVVVDASLSHFSRRELTDCVVSWDVPELERRGEHRASGPFPAASVRSLPPVRFVVPPELRHATRLHVNVAVREPFGREIARGDVMLLGLPNRPARATFPLAVADARLRDQLAARGWDVDGDGGAVMVATTWDDDVAAAVAAGGRTLVFPEAGTRLTGLDVEARPNAAGAWEGDWGGGLGWIRRELCEGLAIGPRVDMAFAGLTPDAFLVGPLPDDPHDVLAGYYLGWVHPESATIARIRMGGGRALVCTFPFASAYARDPLATAMLERLLHLVS